LALPAFDRSGNVVVDAGVLLSNVEIKKLEGGCILINVKVEILARPFTSNWYVGALQFIPIDDTT
jgi:hypothetical protein